MTSDSDRLRRAVQQFAASGRGEIPDHLVQVTSFGGAGTTPLSAYLIEHGLELPAGPGQWPFKHARRPPDPADVRPGFRVVYLVGDPRDAVLSLFRREYQVGHFGAMRGRPPGPAEAVRLRDLDSFLAAGVDEFRLEDHVDQWMASPPGYPVMVIRYEALRDRWEEVAAFVGLPDDAEPLVFRPRHSDWRSEPTEVIDRLEEIYGPLATRIEAMATLTIRNPEA